MSVTRLRRVPLERELRAYLEDGGFGSMCRSTTGPTLERAWMYSVQRYVPCKDCGGHIKAEHMECPKCGTRYGLEFRTCPLCRRKLKPYGEEVGGSGFVWSGKREREAAESALAHAALLGGVQAQQVELDLERDGLSPLTADQKCPTCDGRGWLEKRVRNQALTARPCKAHQLEEVHEPDERQLLRLGKISRLLREFAERAGARATAALCGAYNPELGVTELWHLTASGRRLLAKTPNPQNLDRRQLLASIRLRQEQNPDQEVSKRFERINRQALTLANRAAVVWADVVEAHHRREKRLEHGIGRCRRPL